MRRCAAALALVLAAPALAADPPRTYLREPEGQEDGVVSGLLASLRDTRAAPDARANVVDRLLEEACAPGRRGLLVAIEEARRPGAQPPPRRRWRGLGAHAIDEGLALPAPAQDALRVMQDRRVARATTGDPVALMARYPFTAASAEAALALASRAAAAGDLALVRRHLAWLRRLHPAVAASSPAALSLAAFAAADLGDAPGAERAQAALRALPAPADVEGAKARVRLVAGTAQLVNGALQRPRATPQAPPVAARAVERWWSAALRVTEERRWAIVAPRLLDARPGAEPSEQRVVGTNGAVAVVLDGAGRVVGRVPVSPGSAGAPPSPRTRFVGRIGAHADQAFLPLVLEGWLAPGRAADGAADDSFAGRFYSLCALDGEARLTWWDGEAGAAPDALRAAIGRAHVVAVAADEARVVAAQVVKGDEPALQLVVWARQGGARQALDLQPITLTHLFASERPVETGGSDAPVAPELAAAIHLDGAGRAVITTDAAIACSVDLATGELEWLVRAPTNRPVQGRRFGRSDADEEEHLREPPPEPARALGADRLVVSLGGGALALGRDDGRIAWAAKPEVDRCLVLDRWVVACGARLWLLDPDTGQAVEPVAQDGQFGEGVTIGRTLLIPQESSGGNVVILRRYDLGEGSPPTLVQRGVWPLNGHKGGCAVVAIPGGALVASNARLSWFDWR